CSVGLWSLAAMGHALVRTVTGFSVARALLGIGESGNFPAGVKAVAEWFPKRERALATGVFNAGSNVGVVLAALLVPWIALALGWRWAFVATGALDLAWLAVWLTIYRQPSEHPRLSDAELAWIRSDPVEPAGHVPWRSLLARRQTWAFIVGKAMTDPVWLFYLFWLPKFLDAAFGVRLAGLAAPLVVIYVASDIGSVTGGWVSGARSKRGWSLSRGPKTALLLAGVASRPAVIRSVYHYEDCRHSRDTRLSTARGTAAPRQRLPLGPLRADDRRGRDRHRPPGPGRAGGRWRERQRHGPRPEIVPRRARPAADRRAALPHRQSDRVAAQPADATARRHRVRLSRRAGPGLGRAGIRDPRGPPARSRAVRVVPVLPLREPGRRLGRGADRGAARRPGPRLETAVRIRHPQTQGRRVSTALRAGMLSGPRGRAPGRQPALRPQRGLVYGAGRLVRPAHRGPEQRLPRGSRVRAAWDAARPRAGPHAAGHEYRRRRV